MKTKFLIYTGIFCLAGCISIEPTTRIEFTAPESYPEGIAYDSTSNNYYVSSARLGSIGKVSPAGGYSILHEDTTLKSTYGLKMHPDGKRLFVLSGDANYSKYTSPATRTKMIRLLSIDIATGRKMSDLDLSGLVPGKHFGNDLCFDDKRNVYITDSFAHAVYKVTPDGIASVFTKNKIFETEGIGLNGIVYHPSGFLIADNTNTGQLYKIDINNPDKVEKIAINQYFLGADGLLLDSSDKLTIVVNGGNDKIFQLETEDNWKSATLAASTLIADRFTYPSTATKFRNETWIMNAKFNELTDSNGVPSKTFALQKAVFKPLPKPKSK